MGREGGKREIRYRGSYDDEYNRYRVWKKQINGEFYYGYRSQASTTLDGGLSFQDWHWGAGVLHCISTDESH